MRGYTHKHHHAGHRGYHGKKHWHGHGGKGRHAHYGYGHGRPVGGWCCCRRAWHPHCCWGFHPAEAWCCHEWAWEIPEEYEMCYPHYKGGHAKPKKGGHAWKYEEECCHDYETKHEHKHRKLRYEDAECCEEHEEECCEETETSCEGEHVEGRPEEGECGREEKEKCHDEVHECACEEEESGEEPERE